MAYDAHGALYVANWGGGSVTGDVTPLTDA
jgi:hypothetical protein